MIDLDPLWRVAIVLASVGVIPVLLALEWVDRRARDSYAAVLMRSWWRGHRRRLRHTRTPAVADAPAPAERHARANP